MSKKIRVEGQVYAFPDDATDQEISSHLEEMHEPQPLRDLKKALGYGEPLRNPLDAAKHYIAGLGKTGQGIASTLTGGYAPTVNFDEVLGIKNPNVAGRFIEGISGYSPFAKAASLLKSAKFLPQFAAQTAAGGAFGLTQGQSGQENAFGYLPEGKTGSALEGALINALFHGGANVAEALRPSRMFRGHLTPEELQNNLEITHGTETGLGDVIGSPFMKKRLENTLTNVPFSGANESLQRTGRQLEQRGVNILQDLLGEHDPHNAPQTIAEDLSNQFERHQENKTRLYDRANEIANQSNLRLELPTFARHANEFSEAIDATNMLKFEPDMARIFNKLANYRNPVRETRNVGNIIDKQGNPLVDETVHQYPTLQEANLLKGKLNQYANMAGRDPDPAKRNAARIFGRLANDLRADIRNTISESGNRELESAYNEAERNYARNFSPFLDKDIYKYTAGDANAENIVRDFIRTTPNADLAQQITKLSEKLTPPSRRLLAYSYFSRALDNEGHINPSTLGTAISKLKPNQFEALIPDSNLRRQLMNYSRLQHMNKEAQNLMSNPKTGQRVSDALITGLLGGVGHLASGNVAALGLPAATILAGRGMTRALTSQSLRESLVRSMIENRPMFTNRTRGAQTLTEGLISALQ